MLYNNVIDQLNKFVEHGVPLVEKDEQMQVGDSPLVAMAQWNETVESL